MSANNESPRYKIFKNTQLNIGIVDNSYNFSEIYLNVIKFGNRHKIILNGIQNKIFKYWNIEIYQDTNKIKHYIFDKLDIINKNFMIVHLNYGEYSFKSWISDSDDIIIGNKFLYPLTGTYSVKEELDIEDKFIVEFIRGELYIDGKHKPTLYLKPNKKYIFSQSYQSNFIHPLVFFNNVNHINNNYLKNYNDNNLYQKTTYLWSDGVSDNLELTRGI